MAACFMKDLPRMWKLEIECTVWVYMYELSRVSVLNLFPRYAEAAQRIFDEAPSDPTSDFNTQM